MTQPVADLFWSRAAAADEACVHALVIGVSKYDHLTGGSGPLTTSPLLGGMGQLSAAATSATRIANWLRDNFDYPRSTGQCSPTGLAVPRRGAVARRLIPRPATYEEVKKAVYAWRRDARATPGNITLLFVAGHGIQTSNEGGILLLQDVAGRPIRPLDRALDLRPIRRGMVGDPTDPATWTRRCSTTSTTPVGCSRPGSWRAIRS